MSGELAYAPASGSLVYSPATGELALNCGGNAAYKLTPCIEAGSDCGYCPASTPKWFSAHFVDLLGCCITVTRGNIRFRDVADVWVLLEQDGANACLWVGSVDLTVDQYSTSACTGDPIGTYVVTCPVKLTRTSTTHYTLYITDNDDGINAFIGSLDVAEETDCTDSLTFPDSQTTCYPPFQVGFYGGSGTVYAGDRITAAVRCPGGAAIYTDTDLAAYVGKSITIAEDATPICYAVTANTDPEVSDGAVTVVDSYDTCALCCADT